MFDPASVRFRGPVTVHVAGFWAQLMHQGYAPLSARNLLLVAAHLSRWLEQRRLPLRRLTQDHVVGFMAYRRRQGYTQFLTPRALEPLLVYLRGHGVVRPSSVAPIDSPLGRLLRDYVAYLVQERGLAASTIRSYIGFAREFAVARFGTRHAPQWRRLSPADITEFVLRESRRSSIGYCHYKIAGLRSFLRFLHVRGLLPHDLTGCVPAVAGWSLASLPKALEPDQVARLLRTGDRRSPIACRNAAMVRLLLRLGLRAGDLAALQLDDVDWRAGEIVVRGKSRRESRLPLPPDVGEALAVYLRRGRQPAATRKVFLRSRAPFRALSSGGVITAVVRVLRRAGVPTGGAHLLRHTAATQMLRRGASLSEIAHVLRHQHLATTAIYAEVDFVALRSLAQPWPRGAA